MCGSAVESERVCERERGGGAGARSFVRSFVRVFVGRGARRWRRMPWAVGAVAPGEWSSEHGEHRWTRVSRRRRLRSAVGRCGVAHACVLVYVRIGHIHIEAIVVYRYNDWNVCSGWNVRMRACIVCVRDWLYVMVV